MTAFASQILKFSDNASNELVQYLCLRIVGFMMNIV